MSSPQKQSWAPTIALLALAIVSGVAWRLELEGRAGWAGLRWLAIYHWTIPVGVAAFIGWATWAAPIQRQGTLAASLTVLAVFGYFNTEYALRLFFDAGPDTLVHLLMVKSDNPQRTLERYTIVKWLLQIIWPAIPLLFCLICRQTGAPIPRSRAFNSTLCFLISWPLAAGLWGVSQEIRNGATMIDLWAVLSYCLDEDALLHALKSGFVIPLLVISLGFPLLRLRPQPQPLNEETTGQSNDTAG